MIDTICGYISHTDWTLFWVGITLAAFSLWAWIIRQMYWEFQCTNKSVPQLNSGSSVRQNR